MLPHETRRRPKTDPDDPFERLETIVTTMVGLNREASKLIDKYVDGLMTRTSTGRAQ